MSEREQRNSFKNEKNKNEKKNTRRGAIIF
jgi:hypothetical protein